jgi:Protein of unknown function (DUF4019)
VLPSKYRIHAALILVALLIIFLPLINERPDKEKAAAASAAAEKFLHLVDTDQFSQSWQISASLLKEKVPEQKWVDQLQRTRAITGPLVERAQDSMSYSTSAKDSPEGEYVLITFDTTFKAKSKVSEIVTVMLDKDKTWRVAGYFIK